ncbi:MAG: calcium/sodium antiporter [Thermoanaerobaculia bacterium]|nr:calcium/sodium antiporter [Thermoanaerobaculia bacterium]
MDLLYVALGIALLYGGGEALVRGSVSLARSSGLSPLVVGLTVVSFGTSSPELASTLAAALRGSPEVAFGNVVGSNLANIGLILGLTGLIWPMSTTATFIRREMPFLLLASGSLFWLVVDDRVSRVEGAALLVLLILFLVYLFRREANGSGDAAGEVATAEYRPQPIARSVLLVVLGVALLTLGGNALVTGAVGIARAVGVSERVIGLTVVALGTSLPELASSLVAARERHGDLVLGNLIGSNIFNVLCILGATALIHPVQVASHEVWVDLVVMLAMSALVWPFLATRLELQRWEGAMLLSGYGLYLLFLFS